MDYLYLSLELAEQCSLFGTPLPHHVFGRDGGSDPLPKCDVPISIPSLRTDGAEVESREIQVQCETMAHKVCSKLRDPLRNKEQTQIDKSVSKSWYEWFYPTLLEVDDRDYGRIAAIVREHDSYEPDDDDNKPPSKQEGYVPKGHKWKKKRNVYIHSVVARVHTRFGHRISRSPADYVSVRRFATQIMKDDGHREMHIARDIALVVSLSMIPPKSAIAAEAAIVIGDHDYRGEYGSRRMFRYDPRRLFQSSTIPELDN